MRKQKLYFYKFISLIVREIMNFIFVEIELNLLIFQSTFGPKYFTKAVMQYYQFLIRGSIIFRIKLGLFSLPIFGN